MDASPRGQPFGEEPSENSSSQVRGRFACSHRRSRRKSTTNRFDYERTCLQLSTQVAFNCTVGKDDLGNTEASLLTFYFHSISNSG